MPEIAVTLPPIVDKSVFCKYVSGTAVKNVPETSLNAELSSLLEDKLEILPAKVLIRACAELSYSAELSIELMAVSL